MIKKMVDIISQMNASVLKGYKIPHIDSEPVIYKYKNKYYLAKWVTTYTAEDIQNGYFDRPSEVWLYDMKTGELVVSFYSKDDEFSTAPYNKKYCILKDKNDNYDLSKEYIEKAYAILDKVREIYVDNQLIIKEYFDYLEMVVRNIPKEYKQFYYDLSIKKDDDCVGKSSTPFVPNNPAEDFAYKLMQQLNSRNIQPSSNPCTSDFSQQKEHSIQTTQSNPVKQPQNNSLIFPNNTSNNSNHNINDNSKYLGLTPLEELELYIEDNCKRYYIPFSEFKKAPFFNSVKVYYPEARKVSEPKGSYTYQKTVSIFSSEVSCNFVFTTFDAAEDFFYGNNCNRTVDLAYKISKDTLDSAYGKKMDISCF